MNSSAHYNHQKYLVGVYKNMKTIKDLGLLLEHLFHMGL